MRDDRKTKPTLLASFLAHSGMAALIAAAIMLAAAFFTADRLALAGASDALVSDLDGIGTLEEFASSFPGRGSRIALDSTGQPISGVQSPGMGMGMGMMGYGMGYGSQSRGTGARTEAEGWDRSEEVVDRGRLSGYGDIPWAEGSTVWAAKSIEEQGQGTVILVTWRKASSVRSEGWALYVMGTAGIAVASGLNMALAARVARRLSAGLSSVAESSRRMAAGDYQTRFGPQEVVELDQIASSLGELAGDLKSRTAELVVEKERLAKLEQSQKRFIADASHEIRAPLATMAITLDAWKDGLLTDEEKEDALKHVRDEVARLGALAEQLLDLSRIESGRIPINIGELDVAKVVEDVVSSYRGQQGAGVSLMKEAALPKAMGDEQGLFRIVRNYLDNALGFTPEGGTVSVRIAVKDGFVEVTVADDGPGIPAEELEHVWDRFSRAERQRSVGRPGTGLGLAIVKAVADAMGAEVSLESVEGEGTEAKVRLRVPADC